MGTTAGGVESAIGGLLHGIVNGYGLRQQLLNYKQQNEAYTRKAALDEQSASVQDISNRLMLQQNARPVVNGTVQDTLGAIAPSIQRNQSAPAQATAATADADAVTPEQLGNLPQTRTTINAGAPATTIFRKADPSRTVTYTDRQGNKSQHELLTPDEQNQQAAAAAKAKFMATAVPVQEADGTTTYMDPAHLAAYRQATPQPTTPEAQAAGAPAAVAPKQLPAVIGLQRNAATNQTRSDIADENNQTRSDIAGQADQTRRDTSAASIMGADQRNRLNNQTRTNIASGSQAGANARAALRNSGVATPGQQGVQSRFDIAKLNALSKEEQDYHDVRNRLGPQIASGTDENGKPIASRLVQAQFAKATNNLQELQFRKARVLKAAQPPQDVADKMQEGQQATSPDGHTWLKKDGVVYIVN